MSKNNINATEMTEEEMSERSKHQVQFGIQMPANKLCESVNASVAAGRMSEQDGEVVKWLYGYAQDKGLGWKGLESKMKREVSSATIYGIFMGNYGAADWSGPIRKMREFQRITIEEEKNLDLGFIETKTAKIIFNACDQALNFGMPAFIYGVSQLGKTFSLLEYQRRHNHGRTKYIYVGSGWTKARFVREFAEVCKCYSKSASTADLEYRIFRSLNRYNLVIVDEFHHAIVTSNDMESKRIMEFIREIFDRTKCGLVMCSTKVGLEGLEDSKHRKIFDQIRFRGTVNVVFPDVPYLADINAIARAFQLDLPKGPLLDSIKALIRSRSFGVFIKYLQDAYRTAAKDKEALTWDHFTAVNDLYAALACQKNDY